MAGLPEGELMERAAPGSRRPWPPRGSRTRQAARVVGLVGSGNNGGDTLYAVAPPRRVGLRLRRGRRRERWPTALRQEALAAARRPGRGRAPSPTDDELAGGRALVAEADLVLDGIVGIGGRPGLPAEAAAWRRRDPRDAWVIAVDLPSGADPAGEIVLGDAVFADETVTFGVAKPVHLLPATEPAVGRLTVVDIGLDARPANRPAVERLTFDDVRRLWPVPGASSDKYSRGVVGIVAGHADLPGRGRAQRRSAPLGAGPGMVRYLGPPKVQALVHAAAPEAVTGEGRVQAWVCGSGFDPGSRATGSGRADAPRAGGAGLRPARRRRRRRRWSSRRTARSARPPCSRLTPASWPGCDPAREREEVSRDAGHRGRRWPTPARPPNGPAAPCCSRGRTRSSSAPTRRARCAARPTLLPWVGTAGAGDVLGGLLGTLLAAGLDPLDAGSLGALVHGVAADRTNPGGPVRISEVARRIPETVAALLRRSGGE